MESNPAAELIGQVLRVKRPNPARAEPGMYSTPAEAFIMLRSVCHLTLEEMAAKLGISASMLHKVESSIRGATLQLDQLDILRQMALDCNLKRMANFLKMLHIHAAKKMSRGRRTWSPIWWKEEADRGRID